MNSSTNRTDSILTDVPAASGSAAHPTGNGHLDGKTFAIGILSVTACVLFVGFLLVTASPQPAYGIGQLDRGGDYILLTQQLSESVEGILVVDAAAKAGILYSYDYNGKKIEQVSPRLRLDKLPTRDRKGRPVKDEKKNDDKKVDDKKNVNP